MYGLDALQWSDEAPHDPLIFHTPKHCLYLSPYALRFSQKRFSLVWLTAINPKWNAPNSPLRVPFWKHFQYKYYRRIYELRQPFFKRYWGER